MLSFPLPYLIHFPRLVVAIWRLFPPSMTRFESGQYCIHPCIAISSSQSPGQVLHIVGVQDFFCYCVTTRGFLRKVFPILILRRLGSASSRYSRFMHKSLHFDSWVYHLQDLWLGVKPLYPSTLVSSSSTWTVPIQCDCWDDQLRSGCLHVLKPIWKAEFNHGHGIRTGCC